MASNLSHSTIYFIFEDDAVDDPEHPNKIILGKAAPTIADVSATLRSLFCNGLDLTLSCSFMVDGNRVDFPSDSTTLVPVDDRNNVIRVKSQEQEGAGRLTPAAIALSQWLQSVNLGHLVEPLVKQRVSLEILKFIKDVDLINMGVQDWESRAALLDAVLARTATET